MTLFQLASEELELKNSSNPLRDKLLQCAEQHFLQHGYQRTRINDLIRDAHTTKGGLYHHFSSKQQIAYCLIDEKIRPFIDKKWVTPVKQSDNPAQTISHLCREHFSSLSENELRFGCVLTQMAQTCAAENEGFRLRLDSIFQHWISEWTHAINRQLALDRKKKPSSEALSIQIISLIQGTYTLMKVSLSSHLIKVQLATIDEILKPLDTTA